MKCWLKNFCFVLTCIFTLVFASFAIADPVKPNIVVIFVDDMGYADIGPFGATKQKTPNLNRMAAEGMKLTSFYAASVCSASRAQLMTGCYQARVSVPNVFSHEDVKGLNPAEVTVAERLKPLGYSTACIGKWHLGVQSTFLPTRQGFDKYFGIPYSNDMQNRPASGGEAVLPLLDGETVTELLTEDQQSTLMERYTTEAVSFINDNQSNPFFLYLAYNAIHTPIHPGSAFKGGSDNGQVGDLIEEVDWSVGQILDKIRSLNLIGQTFVLFTSDNGPWLIKGTDSGSSGPLRGGKSTTWEGGCRVPAIAWWPGRILPSSVSDVVMGTIDFLPTAVSMASGTVPDVPVIDGRDMSPVLLDNSTQSPRNAHFYFNDFDLQAVRQGPWKLAVAPQPNASGSGVAPDAVVNPRLYNLNNDIGERVNIAADNPDVVKTLQTLATQFSTKIGGSRPTERRPAGQATNPVRVFPLASQLLPILRIWILISIAPGCRKFIQTKCEHDGVLR